MADLTSVARVVRWGTESMAFNLGHLPADKLDWKPNPESKSALEVTGEVLGVIRMMTGLILKGHFERPPGASGGEGGPMQYPKPADLADARSGNCRKPGKHSRRRWMARGRSWTSRSKRRSGPCWPPGACCGA